MQTNNWFSHFIKGEEKRPQQEAKRTPQRGNEEENTLLIF
jgi:hypothetical protein